jgi:putative heme-binding domain-containing protein
MLVNIIDPSAFIREGYVAYHIKTKDKRSIVGTMKSQHGSTIVIQPFNGEDITLDGNQVEEMTEQSESLMPEGLLNGLSDQDVRDLIAYISQDR